MPVSPKSEPTLRPDGGPLRGNASRIRPQQTHRVTFGDADLKLPARDTAQVSRCIGASEDGHLAEFPEPQRVWGSRTEMLGYGTTVTRRVMVPR